MKTKEEIIQTAKSIAEAIKDIHLQIETYIQLPSFVEEYYLGLLIREEIILGDIVSILEKHDNKFVMSAFILSRVLLDDFIRIFCVFSSSEMEEEVSRIMADAQKHIYNAMEQSASINEEYYKGQDKDLFTREKYEAKKEEILKEKESERLFDDKATFKFKKLPPIANAFNIIKEDVKINANVHCKIEYKVLSQYVHYSNITYRMDNDKETRKYEIAQFENTLLYCFKILCMQYEFFKKSYPIEWKYNELEKTMISGTRIV